MSLAETIPDSGVQDRWQSLPAELLERTLIVAANRGPVSMSHDENGDWSYERGPGGLVTALTGLAQKLAVTWVACASTSDDATWGSGMLPLSQNGRAMRLRFLKPEPASFEGYYNVISNPLLWFLQHSMWDIPRSPIIDRATWTAWHEGYLVVNQLFARELADLVRAEVRRPLVMLQDYHLYLTGRYLRQTLKPKERPPVLHFIHIPWPGPEYWRILPPAMRHAILDGLCAADLLGFQTEQDGLNFIRTCELYLTRARVNFRYRRIWYRNHATHIRDFPISIDVDGLKSLAASPSVAEWRAELERQLGDRKMILRIDRVEPSKNIVRGFQAFADLLQRTPHLYNRVQLLALLVPSRLGLGEYRNYLDEVMAAAGRINAAYGTSEWEPVRILIGEDYSRAVAALQLYDILLVNSVADGMNLVAKEGPIVNERNGVLILSEGTGARQQLAAAARVIPPCDIWATSEALRQALEMPMAERGGVRRSAALAGGARGHLVLARPPAGDTGGTWPIEKEVPWSEGGLLSCITQLRRWWAA